MTHALINALSQIAAGEMVVVGMVGKVVCVVIAVGVSRKCVTKSDCEK